MVPRSSIGKSNFVDTIVPPTWAFKIKHFTDYLVRKYKARFCVHGDLQKCHTEEPMDTYAPVVKWNTI